jgi:hypothetical protein
MERDDDPFSLPFDLTKATIKESHVQVFDLTQGSSFFIL